MSTPIATPASATDEHRPHRVWPVWLAAVLSAAPVALLFTIQHAILLRLQGHVVLFDRLLAVQLVRWYLWVALVPGVVAAARRLRPEPALGARDVAWRVARLGIAGVVLAAVHAVLSSLFDQWLVGEVPARPYGFGQRVLAMLLADLLVYAGLLAVYYAGDFYVRYRERELQASRLRARLAEARLALLQQRLQPHFLFNTLNAVSSLMREDVDAADEMLAALSELLRAALRDDDAREVPLRDELGFTGRYLDIMKLRLGPRLGVTVDVAGDALDALVPTLLLQPLVENAVRHGIADRVEGGAVTVRAGRRDGSLWLTVADDGPGLPNDWESRGGHGVGLSATHARLAQMYGAAHELTLRNRSGGGLEVTVVLPYRAAPASAAPGARP